jgi:hypothetical protein
MLQKPSETPVRQTHSTMKTAIKASSVDEGLGGVLFNYSLGCSYNEP